MKLLVFLISAISWYSAHSQIVFPDNKKALIILTYDDALNSQLDNALPELDKAGLKATFFLNQFRSVDQIDRWKKASENGHELANHSVFHPCQSHVYPADPRYQAENYTVSTMIREISVMNQLLYAIDHKAKHTYAYPCGVVIAGSKSYVDSLSKCGFVTYARTVGSNPIIKDLNKLDPFQVPCQAYNAPPDGLELISFIKQVVDEKAMAVLIFHGVRGDYLQVSNVAHRQMLEYLKSNSKDIWVTTFEKGMEFDMKAEGIHR